jgi:hypothetical protein
MSIVAAGLIFSASGHAAVPVDPSAHHPAAGETAGATNMGDSDATMSRMDEHINRMHEMHVKLTAATTPAVRDALRAEHMQTMQDGMDMMGTMMAKKEMAGMKGMPGMGMSGMGKSGDSNAAMPAEMAMHHSMMQKHMQMMHSMMQLMIDAMPQPNSGS